VGIKVSDRHLVLVISRTRVPQPGGSPGPDEAGSLAYPEERGLAVRYSLPGRSGLRCPDRANHHHPV